MQFAVDFSTYTGSGKYIAFRNVTTNTDAVSQNWIDDINISEVPAVTCQGITVPYEQGFELSDENLDCWTFVSESSNSTVPQIASSYANSGNYSLYMSGRGTYAMPEVTNVDNVSGIEMTFYVRQRVVAHRIAVGVMTDPSNPATFVEVARFSTGNNTSAPMQFAVDFSSYTGSGKYIAFRNVTSNADAVSQNWIDDINISLAEPRIVEIAEYNQNYGESDAADGGQVHDPLGVSDFDLSSLTVYPNPTTGLVTIGAEEVERVEVYNQIGVMVSRYTNERVIDLGNLSSGIYMLRVTMPQGVAIRKVVKK